MREREGAWSGCRREGEGGAWRGCQGGWRGGREGWMEGLRAVRYTTRRGGGVPHVKCQMSLIHNCALDCSLDVPWMSFLSRSKAQNFKQEQE